MASSFYFECMERENQTELTVAINKMVEQIADILSFNDPSVYIFGSYVLNDFQFGWSDIDILVLTDKTISEQQANELVCLRQRLTASEPNNPFYRLFEGGIQSCFFFFVKYILTTS